MFLHLSVILFTRGGSLSRWRVSFQGVSVWGRSLSGGGPCPSGVSVRGSLSGGLCPGVSVQGVSIQGSPVRGGSALTGGGGLCLGWVSVQGDLSGSPPRRRTVTCGRYACYWNAFLLTGVFTAQNTGVYNLVLTMRTGLGAGQTDLYLKKIGKRRLILNMINCWENKRKS